MLESFLYSPFSNKGQIFVIYGCVLFCGDFGLRETKESLKRLRALERSGCHLSGLLKFHVSLWASVIKDFFNFLLSLNLLDWSLICFSVARYHFYPFVFFHFLPNESMVSHQNK